MKEPSNQTRDPLSDFVDTKKCRWSLCFYNFDFLTHPPCSIPKTIMKIQAEKDGLINIRL